MSSQLFRIQEHILPGQHIRHYPHSTANSQEEIINFVVKQYTPLENIHPRPGDVTIIGAHANGFPKELYEPLWEDILTRSKQYGLSIRNIWIADFAFQGQSGVVNEGKLGNDPSWYDHARDLLLMINHFRSEMPRPIVGIGHSMGGNNLVFLSLMHPRLLETLILIDPIVQRFASVQGNFVPSQASSRRRDRWPSRAAAAAAFRKSAFYQKWDSRVLDRWIEHGLRELPTALYTDDKGPPSSTPEGTAVDSAEIPKEVTLKTTKHMEVFTFMRPNWDPVPNRKTHADAASPYNSNWPFYRPEPSITFAQIPNLRPSVLYIFGTESTVSSGPFRADKLANTGIGVGGSGGVKEGNVKELMIQAGHLIPMEAVKQTAESCLEWLSERVGKTWRDEEAREAEEWARLSSREKSTMSEEYLRKLQGAKLDKPKL
ncbi:MAG: hypothetical protein M1820_000514 [Bogoriella megaspora]|nr:MAG: hypothetical protein M1820_000514 [Bogoriella megaspora]